MNATKKKRYIYGGIAAILIILIGSRIYAFKHKQNVAAAYTVAKQDVKQTVLATGTVTSNANLNLSFKNSGVLAKVNVNVGDQVKQGQVLAMLDERDASSAVSQAAAALSAAKANYDKVVAGASSQDIDVSQAAVTAAQVALNNAKNSYNATAQQQNTAVSSALSAMLNSGLAAVPAATNSSTATISITGTYTGTQQGSYKITVGVNGSGYTFNLSGLESTDSQIARGLAQPIGTKGLYANFSTSGTLSPNDYWIISIPNTQASTYLTNYNAYQAALQTQAQALTAAQGAIDTAQAALSQAQAQLALKQAQARPQDIEAAQAQIDTAQAQLQTAQNNYQNNIITAPISGVITSVDAKIGETVPPQKEVVVLLDKNSLHVESNISESSIAQVKPAQQIDMTLDAFGPDTHFTGQVLSIDPAATVVSGVINYRVISSLPDDQSIKPGMTANLVINIASKDGVLAVPNRLIKSLGDKKYVSIVAGSSTRDVLITTGLVGDGFTEITSGLNLGDVLASPINATSSQSNGIN